MAERKSKQVLAAEKRRQEEVVHHKNRLRNDNCIENVYNGSVFIEYRR